MANGFGNGYPQIPNNYGLNQQDFSQSNNFRSISPYNQGYNNQDSTQEIRILKGRPVSSIEEARALSIDLDGSITYFPDRANKRIYAKYFNPDGSASFEVYVKDNSVETKPQYVTQQELSEAITNMKMSLISYIAGVTETGKSDINNNISQSLKAEPFTANQNNENSQRQSFNI